MSLCDKCTNPGRCCSGFHLSIEESDTYLEALTAMTTVWTGTEDEQHIWLGLPFMPLYKTSVGAWLYWCQYLGRDGRCTIYEDRPQLCRSYEPGQDMLCAMHTKEE